VNAQSAYKSSNKSYDKKKGYNKDECKLCGYTNHFARDCRFLESAKALARESKDKNKKKSGGNKNFNKKGSSSKASNSQTAVPIKVKGNPNGKESELELDATDNLFYKLFNQCHQEATNGQFDEDLLLPTTAGGAGDATSFVLEASVANATSGSSFTTKVLLDTGANISTITRHEAERMGLEFHEAPPIKIVYDNSSKGASNQAVWFPCSIQGQEFGGFYVRVVKGQSITTIFGMDWLLKNKLLIDPLHKKLIPRSSILPTEAHLNSAIASDDETQIELLHYIPSEIVDILLIHPKIYNSSELQTITNAPVTHRIDTGDHQPVTAHWSRTSHKEDGVIDEETEKMLKRGGHSP
jgi:hypothetical protein